MICGGRIWGIDSYTKVATPMQNNHRRPLTDTLIKEAKPKDRAYKLFDERGLYLLVSPNGTRAWRFKYRFAGKEQGISFGLYPDVSLKIARDKRDAARKEVSAGINPSAKRQAEKQATSDTTRAMAEEWMQARSGEWSADHSCRTRSRFTRYIYPRLGSRPIASIQPTDILACIRRIEANGRIDTAHRTLQQITEVFQFAVQTGRLAANPARELRGALAANPVQHHAAITHPEAVGALLRAIDGYHGGPVVRAALRLAPMLLARPGEIRQAEWNEMEIEGREKQWRIPASKMKMRKEHIVPLASQAVAILKEIREITGPTGYVFPSIRDASRPMSDGTLNVALQAIGYTNEQMTPHGFRSTGSTLLNERGFNRDWIERQLAHCEENKSRKPYNHAEYLPQRRDMMQKYADYLDELRAGVQKKAA
jgi:integrase